MQSSAEHLSIGIYQPGSQAKLWVWHCRQWLWQWHSASKPSSTRRSLATSRHVAKMYTMCSSSGEMRRSNACCLWRSTRGSALEHTRTVSSKGFGSLNFPAINELIAEWIKGMLPGHQYGETHPTLPPAVYTPFSNWGISFQSVTAMWPLCFGSTGAWLRMSENKSVLGRQTVKDGQIKTIIWRRSNWKTCHVNGNGHHVKFQMSRWQWQFVKSIGQVMSMSDKSMSMTTVKIKCEFQIIIHDDTDKL